MKDWFKELSALYSDSSDFLIRQLNLEKTVTVVSLDTMVDDTKVLDSVIEPLVLYQKVGSLSEIQSNVAFSYEVNIPANFSDLVSKFLNGHTAIFMDGEEKCLTVDTRTTTGRAVTEPPTSVALRGPREGFIEDLKVNVTLLRKRLKTTDFKVKDVVVGKYTNTSVAVCYIEGVADKKVVDKIIQQIQSISIDGIIDSSYLSHYLNKPKTMFFNRVGTTEKPDIAVGKILEGRVCVLVDGSPIALTLPYLFIEDLQSPNDYHQPNEVSSIGRILRYLSVIASVLLPALFVCLEKFNYQIIPIKFLVTIINATEGIPFSAVTEMLIVIIIFDILREANLRMPTAVGMSLSLVGAIVLGDAAVKAGLLGAPAVMVGALSGIGLYVMPENTLVLSLLRLIFVFIGGFVGILGVILSTLALLCYMVSFSSIGTPFMAPFAPQILQDHQDAVLMSPLSHQKKRPKSLNAKNTTRRAD